MHQGKEMQDFKQLSVDKMTPYQKLIGGRIQRVCILFNICVYCVEVEPKYRCAFLCH